MDRKWIAVVVMTAVTVGLAILLGHAMQSPREAFAQGGRYADYVTGSADFEANAQVFVVIDTDTRRVMFYIYDVNRNELRENVGYDLNREFRRTR